MTSFFGVAPTSTSSSLISDRSLAALSILTENSENSRVAPTTGPSLLIARLHHSFPDEPQKLVPSRQLPPAGRLPRAAVATTRERRGPGRGRRAPAPPNRDRGAAPQ